MKLYQNYISIRHVGSVDLLFWATRSKISNILIMNNQKFINISNFGFFSGYVVDDNILKDEIKKFI